MLYVLHIIILSALTLPSLLGLNLVLGKGRVLHFGHIGTSLIAAYVLVLTYQFFRSTLLSIIFAGAAVSFFSLLLAYVARRFDDDAFGILSLALYLIIQSVILNWPSVTRGSLGIPDASIIPFLASPLHILVASLLCASLMIVFMYAFQHSSYGRALSALAEHPHHAVALGIRRSTMLIIIFQIAGVGALVTQSLWIQYVGLLHPSDYHYYSLIFLILCITAGGPGKLRGVIVAALLFTTLKEALRFLPLPAQSVGPTRLLLFGTILIVSIYARRKEIFPMSRRV